MYIPTYTLGMKGFLRFQTINKFSGKVTSDTGFFPNLLLDAGRNYMATADFMTSCQVGTDNTAPNVSQTQLSGYHAGTTDIRSDVVGNQVSVTPYYGWRRKVFRFAPGTVAANLSEAGVGWGTSGSTLISRALILDPVLQTPTTVTPLADEFLEVTYELRYYPPTTDVTSPSVTLNGIVYDTITRGAEVNSQYWTDYIGNKIGALGSQWYAYDGNIGTVLQNPSGSFDDLDSYALTNETYQNNSYEQVISCFVDVNSWNLGSGIRSVRWRTTAGSFQTQFNANPGGATIPKSTSYFMNMKWKLAWAAI
jgi:hypothetical protein